MRVLVLVIVSFDKPEYHDMLAVWRERARDDVWFIQCKSDKEWIGDVINDIVGERSSPMLLRVSPPLFLEDSQKSHSLGSHSLESHSLESHSLGSHSLGSHSLESHSLESHSLESHSLESHSLESHSLKDRFELDVANKTLYVRGDECLIPGILHKTVEALSFFLRELRSLRAPLCLRPDGCMIPPYDYVWRTNLSSVLDFEGLERFLSSLSQPNGLYAGYIGKALNNGSPTFFASGAGFLMSRDVAMYLVENKEFLRWDLIDDVAIGALLEPRFGLMHLERCWVQSEHIVAEKDVFHFRCESYQHLRTVEFMRLASKWIADKNRD